LLVSCFVLFTAGKHASLEIWSDNCCDEKGYPRKEQALPMWLLVQEDQAIESGEDNPEIDNR
jgi:hypothetical protein